MTRLVDEQGMLRFERDFRKAFNISAPNPIPEEILAGRGWRLQPSKPQTGKDQYAIWVDGQEWVIHDRSPGDVEANRFSAVNTLASDLILSRYPGFVQDNMNARLIEFQDIPLEGNRLTAEQEIERSDMRAAIKWISAVRQHAGVLKADPSSDIDRGWPT